VPLVTIGGAALDEPLSEAHGRARKVNPLYSEGPLVRVAWARNQAEAELIQGLLLEEGIPSMLRRSAGFDVPDFLAAGPRDVVVPQAGAELARDLLGQTGLAPAQDGTSAAAVSGPRMLWLVASIVGGGAIAALIAWLLQGGG
jgi:hypothetical protein